MKKEGPLLLAILDGWGEGDSNKSNAIRAAYTPNMDRFKAEYPSTTLLAHNGAVGLPEGQMGNSEVGHLNIGAGRVVYQDFTRINRAIETGDLLTNKVLVDAMDVCLEKDTCLHLLGLVSDGGVHSHIDHLVALIQMAADKGLDKVFVHAFMDGRDTSPTSGAGYMQDLLEAMKRIGVGEVATVSGRYYAMDRDNRWDRVEKAWKAIVDGQGVQAADPVAVLNESYGRDETDEFIKPVVITRDGRPVSLIADGDTVFFFNFRADRARELTRAFTVPGFDGFQPQNRPQLQQYIMMTMYDKTFDLPVAFPPQKLTRILGEEISTSGLKQLRIAETEKYAHVTFFFNGGVEKPFALEDRVLIPSPKEVATYDEKPEMSAYAVTDALLAKLDEGYDVIILNFANADMVGHTGIFEAAIKACEVVDDCIGRIVAKVQEMGGTTLITADHGNADEMVDENSDEVITAHSLNQVPFIVVDDAFKGKEMRSGGALKDIAPTVLHLLGIAIPKEMEGECLIV
ncbi:MAG: 2,3-bisphosphoglycerate-independent phosphoglycerate mutase [Desulfobulbaceae bacterium]|uniref:2,3-bisphosphoglycerate-independent phosphoglycerate mutase n=1 Tax=Candidatus Desulfobia pelagia TaxID=2841692 RepID=A0A8J6NCI0_9BACT|nr:2,3-bisphosphoglycerate-independent phosphoglycerate mutase [Candidatus Desulfobia pelagia]